jgi:Na+-driven multidrug efflux pump
MNSQLVVTVIHCLFNYILVDIFNWGVVGTGLSGMFTNIVLLSITVYQTYQEEELVEAIQVSIFNRQVYDQWYPYLNIGLPNCIIIFFDWSCYEVMTLMSGYIGVDEQAT